jgi:hypothetical protein
MGQNARTSKEVEPKMLTHSWRRTLRLMLLIAAAAALIVLVAGCGHGGNY